MKKEQTLSINKKNLKERKKTIKSSYRILFLSMSLLFILLSQAIITYSAAKNKYIPLHHEDVIFYNSIIIPTFTIIVAAFLVHRKRAIEMADAMSKELIDKSNKIIELKDEMLSLISHQLKTPLTAIIWSLESMQQSNTQQNEQTQNLKQAYQTAKHLNGMLSTLLNIARVESGEIKIQAEPTDLNQIIRTVTKDINHRIEAKKQTLTLKTSPLPKINLDQELVHHIILNLASNASKYSQEHQTITIISKQYKQFAVIEVTDQGYGIPNSEQKKLFSKYYRAQKTKDKTEGTGLGLYLVKQITDILGLHIKVKSAPNKGTTFFLYIPLSGVQSKDGKVKLDLVK